MPYGITQSYLPPGRGTISCPYPGVTGWFSIYPPIKVWQTNEASICVSGCERCAWLGHFVGAPRCRVSYPQFIVFGL